MVDAPHWWRAPMLCKTAMREELDIRGKWDGYVAEPKHDGVRALIVTDAHGAVSAYSRSGQDYTRHLNDDLTESLRAWLPANTVADGELAIFTRTAEVMGRTVPVSNFNATARVLGSAAARGRALQTELGPLGFIAYDLPRIGGDQIDAAPFAERRAALADMFPHMDPRLTLNPQFTDPAVFAELFDALVDSGIEGIIAKNTAAVYAFDGRPNKTWYKVKAAITVDMVVTGYTEGRGKYEGLIGAIEFGRWTPDGVVAVGRCSGMTDAFRREVSANREAFLGKVIEVKSNELVGSKEYRTPRHPQFVCVRTDKRPEDCLGDELRRKDTP